MNKVVYGCALFLVSLALAGCGVESTSSCETNDDCVAGYLCNQGVCDEIVPVSIDTEELDPAIVEVEYEFALEASDGITPYDWRLLEAPDWMTINHSSGILGGTPDETASGLVVKVKVTDFTTGRDSSAEEVFDLDVNICMDEDEDSCFEVDQDKCMQGTRLCTGGVWGVCKDQVHSVSEEHCGPDCGACDEIRADGCVTGSCVCGGSAMCDQGQGCCEASCIDVLSDDANCGACDVNCAELLLNTVDPHCEAGACIHGGCVAGFIDCDVSADCETLISAAVCGACANDCRTRVEHVSEILCVETAGVYECGYEGDGTTGEGCEFGFLDCDGDRTNGCEAVVSQENCPSCGQVCPSECLLHASGEYYYCGCDQSEDCGAERQCCDNQCYDLFDPAHCGSCENDCNPVVPHVQAAACDQGICDYTTCEAGWLDCDGNRVNGCETQESDDDCGECGFSCGPHGQCAQSTCVCNDFFGNCDDDWGNSCETDLRTTTDHCGACETDCVVQVENASGEFCANELCDFADCDDGWGSCDNDRTDGCEENIWQTDNCGLDCAGRVDCNQQVVNASETACTEGLCDYGSCLGGFGNCNHDRTDGCEEDIWQTTSCGTNCTNRVNCNTEVLHSGTQRCTSGLCDYIDCYDGYNDCDDDRTNGCEENIWRVDSCGTGCDNTVNCNTQVVHASGKRCTSGQCDYIACTSGYGDCDYDTTNGCEDYLWETNDCRINCSDSGIDCDVVVQNAGAVLCNGGSCDYLGYCNQNYGDCDDDGSNGCETYTFGNDDHCGACDHRCQDVHSDNTCVGSNCQPVCDPLWGDCDDNEGNGCEQNLTVHDHCGSCDHSCGAQMCCDGICMNQCP